VGRLSRAAERKAWTEFIERGVGTLPTVSSKYGNTKIEYNGRWFDSLHEANEAAKLQALEKAGKIRELKYQVRITLVPKNPPLRAIVYVADFTYIDLDGNLHVLDAKGFKTQVYRLKKKLAAHMLGIQIEEI